MLKCQDSVIAYRWASSDGHYFYARKVCKPWTAAGKNDQITAAHSCGINPSLKDNITRNTCHASVAHIITARSTVI